MRNMRRGVPWRKARLVDEGARRKDEESAGARSKARPPRIAMSWRVNLSFI